MRSLMIGIVVGVYCLGLVGCADNPPPVKTSATGEAIGAPGVPTEGPEAQLKTSRKK